MDENQASTDQPLEPETVSVTLPNIEQRQQIHLRQLVDRFGHIVLDMSACLGRSKMTLRTLLALKGESIVTLDKQAGEKLELHLNQSPFGFAEVQVDDNQIKLQITGIGLAT